jgi:hypothetical protein
MAKEELNQIVLVGGSTRIPKVRSCTHSYAYTSFEEGFSAFTAFSEYSKRLSLPHTLQAHNLKKNMNTHW